MNGNLTEILEDNWDHLTDKEQDHIAHLQEENKKWYDKIVELINQPDYKQICKSAKHTANPRTDIKGRVITPIIVKDGLEMLGELALCGKDLREIYLIAENTYQKLKYGQKIR